MSTVIGLLKEEKQLSSLTERLQAAGCTLDRIRILTQPGEVHALLDETAMAKCEMPKCVGLGALAGMAIFLPVGVISSLIGCFVFGCSPLIWLVALGGFSLIGALSGAAFGCFFSGDRYERHTHLYTEGVGWGNKLMAVTTDTRETEARTAQILQEEDAIAVKIIEREQ
jgi:hypothetical protein